MTKKNSDELGFPPLWSKPDELDDLFGLPGKKPAGGDITDKIARDIARKTGGENPQSPLPEKDKNWMIHKKFAELYEKFGNPFARFVGDLLDILLGGPILSKLMNELIVDTPSEITPSKRSTSLPFGSAVSGGGTSCSGMGNKPTRLREDSKAGPTVSQVPQKGDERDIKLGGESRIKPRHFLKKKNLLAKLFLDRNEFSGFTKVIKQISVVCKSEKKQKFTVPSSKEERKTILSSIVNRLTYEISQDDLILAWLLLEADDFVNLEWVYTQTRSLSLVRPSFQEDLDKAYREAKRLLKLLVTEFEGNFPTADKKEIILEYLRDILEVYTHHHFVLKFYHQTRPTISREEIENKLRDLNARIEDLRSENTKLRNEMQQTIIGRDNAKGEERRLSQEAEELKIKMQKLDPAEVSKQARAWEAKINQINRDYQATIEEDSELRSQLRQMDAENQRLTQQLRELHAIPDETAKSVEGLLLNKRVVVFGGVGKDHYWPLLKEAGVKEADYEWYEGYHTISQARTSEIVGRCDLAVVITSYAGHLLLHQTRNSITPRQTLFLIHNSGAGSLRLQIIEKFKKSLM